MPWAGLKVGPGCLQELSNALSNGTIADPIQLSLPQITRSQRCRLLASLASDFNPCCFCCCCCCCCCCCRINDVMMTCTEVWSGANERRLINDLGLYDVRVYNKLERPVVNESESLVVSFSLVLQQIIGVVSDQWRHCLIKVVLASGSQTVKRGGSSRRFGSEPQKMIRLSDSQRCLQFRQVPRHGRWSSLLVLASLVIRPTVHLHLRQFHHQSHPHCFTAGFKRS